MKKAIRTAGFLEKFKEIEAVKISALSDMDLAEWQCKYPPESPQWLLASFEWQRRLTVEQIRSVRFAAWLSGILAFIGAVICVTLGWWLRGVK